MIVPMKKIYVVMQAKDAKSALDALRDLGVVHVEPEHPPAGSGISELKMQMDMLARVLEVLPEKAASPERLEKTLWQKYANEVLDLNNKIAEAKEEVQRWQNEIQRWQAWGNFDPQDILDLEARGIHIQFFEMSAAQLKKFSTETVIKIIHEEKNRVRCIVFSRQEFQAPATGLMLPAFSLRDMQNMRDNLREDMRESADRLKALVKYRAGFKEILAEKEAELKFAEALHGMGEKAGLNYLKGFIPADQEKKLREMSRTRQWGVLVEDPAADDTVPTLIRNPKWVEMITPLFGLMNIVPGYKEKDISVFFLIFFSIFFSLLVGDAGYGSIFLIVTFVVDKRFGRRMADKSVIGLMYLLSICTIIWGLLTGTFFGTLLFGRVIRPVLPWLTDAKNLQFLCFLLGVIHLTIAHLWRSITRGPTLGALAEIGWIMALWGSFFLVNMMLLGTPLPGFVKYLYMIGAALIVIDIIAQRKDIGVNFILFVFSMINTFGDIVSYIRLFAVGLAGVAVADAFNQMALSIGFGNIFSATAAVFILAFVHLFLNLALCIMGVLVHGVRLNVLEFSGHLGMEWSGIKYNPLRVSKQIV